MTEETTGLHAAPEATSTTRPEAPRDEPKDARGGRLFDHWRAEKGLTKTFVPDDPKTPAPDGSGGPNGNGTLNDASGSPQLNTGHDYRLKNLFGWDLRGKAGIYGPAYQDKAYVLPIDLLTLDPSEVELLDAFANGGDGIPALGSVLDPEELAALVDFIVRVREHRLPRPDDIFELSASAPKNYTLKAGGDATRGHQLFAARCAECHGDDGTKLLIDETETAGSVSRSSGYEVWLKILNGHPGSEMKRQIDEAPVAEQVQAILDLFAALCDATQYPAKSGGSDASGADARCGTYLRLP